MKIKNVLTCGTALLLLTILLGFNSVPASDSAPSPDEKYLSIASMDSRPIFVDRLIYLALKGIEYNSDFTCVHMQTGYELADAGERDGVISLLPGMEELYPNLRKVPVALEEAGMYAVVRKDSGISGLSGWEDMNGKKVGVLTQSPYIYDEVLENNPTSVTTKETNAVLLTGLIEGEYDIAILTLRFHEKFALDEKLEYAGMVDTQTEYLYLNKRHENIIPAITESLQKLFENGQAEDILNYGEIRNFSGEKTILHIISANMQITREEQFIASLKEKLDDGLPDSSTSFEWYTVEMNAKRFSRDPSRLTNYGNILRQDSISRNISAIVVSGDDAIEFLKEHYFTYFGNVPVLYYGMVEESDEALKGFDRYFTGIKEKLSVYETASLALELFPDTKKIFVINDYLTEGEKYRKIIERQLEPFADSIDIEYNENTDFNTLARRVGELPGDTIVVVGSYFCDSYGQYYPLKTTKKMLENECAAPIFSGHSTNVEYDAIGGKCLDYEKYGEIIAGMLKRALDGEIVGAIPEVSDPELYSRWAFDAVMLERFNISERSLPEGSLIINKTLSIWDTDPRFALTLVALLVLGIAAAASISFLVVRYRKQKELVLKDNKIREVKERLEQIINTAPLAFMSSVNDVVVDANEYIRKNVGVEPGKNPSDFYDDPGQRNNILSKASLSMVKNQVIRLNMLSGEKNRFLSNYSSVEFDGEHGFIFWAMDIEEVERQKDELNTARQDLQMLIDTMPVPIRITDCETAEIIYANNACLKLFGCAEFSDMRGRNVVEYMPDFQSDGTPSHEKAAAQLRSGEAAKSIEIEYVTVNGIKETLVTSCNIVYEGKRCTISILADLTAEREQQRLLLNAAEKEKEANQLKSRFLVNMSHEIRTPMNAIIGLTEIELRKKPPKETKEIYKKINVSAKNLLEIINDILDLSKIEADKIELFDEEFELEEVLNSALLVASPRLDGKNVEFMLNESLDLPRYVIGDRTRLWQVLKNFLDNSAKFTEEGRIALTASINNELSDSETITITFTIDDTGIGIDEAQIQRLFLPYEQIRNEAQKRYSGTGLGMAISKQLCEIMGGNLKVESKKGEGTTIVANIPFKRSESDETELQVIKTPALEGIDILAVDDDNLSLEIMSNLLEGAGASCVLAKSGLEAMDIILQERRLGNSFDMILLDYMMDGLNGLETAKQIHLALSKAPKLLMVTAYQKLLLKNDLDESGIDDIIEKPFIPSHFIHKIHSMFGYEDVIEEQEDTFAKYKDVTVLLCEDYPLNQEVALGMFAEFGVEADIAENGERAVELIKSGKEYDLIFMDLQMPVMDGYEATRVIRADSSFDKIPIISLTADAMKEIVDTCIEIGMNDHIAKPIEFDALNRAFQKWLPAAKRLKDDKLQKTVSEPINKGLARFGGDKERYNRALLDFAENLLPAEWEDFDSAIKNKEKTERFIHKIKGAAGNLDENGIYIGASDFEATLRRGTPDRNMYNRLTNASAEAKARILSMRPDKVEKILEEGTPERFNELLDSIKEALDEYNPVESANAVKQLKESAWPFADQQALKLLYEHVRKYEFDDAIDLLNTKLR